MSRFDASEVRDYYEANTASFVAYGQGGGEGAIHRAVWAPGVTTRAQAFHYVDDRIAELIAASPPPSGVPHVVDLGCGVGASLCYLASRVPMSGTGVTLSPTQAALARDRIRTLGLDRQLTCVEGDYADLPAAVAGADIAFAIESLVHAADPARVFAQCSRLVRPGGFLAICDDVRRDPPASEQSAAAAAVDRFCRGWHVNSLQTAEALRALAAASGFTHHATTDLTPWLGLRRPRDLALAAVLLPFRWLPVRSRRLAALDGGAALHACLVRGWVGYELAIFRRDRG